MYLRHMTRRKDGKFHTYWRLVRSIRVERKVIHQTVAHLGELDAQGRARARALAQALTGSATQAELFGPPEVGEAAIPIRVDCVRVERERSFGDDWVDWTLWGAAVGPAPGGGAASGPGS